MKKANNYIFILPILGLLFSCGGLSDAEKVLRNEKIKNTDEFLVKKREPLTLPPEHNSLPEPNTIKKSKKDSKDEIDRILKISEDLKSENKNSSTEQSIIDKIGK
tara:strand:+ start:368 stop:682 length:315 start_codon:yes stop_codon:yes gene_type:complete